MRPASRGSADRTADRDGRLVMVMRGGNEIAFIGLGGMGAGMAQCLLASGTRLVVHNRTVGKAVPLSQFGARVAVSAAEAGRAARIVFLSLSDEAAVEQVLFGELRGCLRTGTLVVGTSTVSPGYAVDAARRLEAAGVRYVEACVLGNPAMAAAGKLRIFAAGQRECVDEVRGLLDVLAQEVRYVGPAGLACALKLSFNMILGNQIAALAEAVSLAEASGLSRDLLLTAVANSGVGSPTLAFRAELMRRRRYDPAAFRSVLMEKDLRLAASEAVTLGFELPLTTCAAALFAETVRAGSGDKDAAVIAELRSPPRRP